jgi:amino-acid N-acetyltransferase
MAHRIEKAVIADAPLIHRLINSYAERGTMLPRPLSEIYENIRDFFVVREEGRLVACAGLHVSWSDLAEVKSLAVAAGSSHKGLGSELVRACLEEAGSLGIPSVFCLTYVPGFFEKCGFGLVERTELPHKIWGECYRCPKYPDCDETAMMYRVAAQ